MTIPFLDLFKRLTGRSAPVADEPLRAASRVIRPKKPASERLSKTVLPHSRQSFSPPDPFRAAAGAGSSSQTPSLQLGPRKVTASPSAMRSHGLPPALARALEPKLERTISLRISDFIDQVPSGYIKPVEILDAAARVSLKASEIEKGMPEKHPTISLPSLYQQVPEVFLRGVRPDDATRVALPYEKVLEQFESLHVRADQLRDPAVPQLETPILTATMQDSTRFGTKIEPIETSPLPPIPVEPATAGSIAAAEPEAIVQGKAEDNSIPPGRRVISLHSPELAPKSESPRPSRTDLKIPFDLSPNGTGALASERVPASSGPPVPTTLPFTPQLEKIVPPPVKAVKSSAPLTLTKPVKLTKDVTSSPAKDDRKITLALKPILQGLPPFQFSGEVAEVGDDERIEFALSLIEAELASGRITVSPEVFRTALAEKHRGSFQIDEAKTAVVLPLEEVLKNLPATVLKLRDDQVQVQMEADKDFETPFLIKAREDAERLREEKAPPAEIEKPEQISPEPKMEPAAIAATEAEASIVPPAAVAPKVEEKIDPKEIVAQASALPGVKACAITFADGLSLAGELPEELAADGLCAMGPSFLGRIDQHMRESKLGPLINMTLHSADAAISFFSKKNICLTVLHAGGSLAPETRAELAELASKLSRTYAQSE